MSNVLKLKTTHGVITLISLSVTPLKLTQDGVDCGNLSWREILSIATNDCSRDRNRNKLTIHAHTKFTFRNKYTLLQKITPLNKKKYKRVQL